ncbi:hypothetical protein ACC668_17530 [Rhizobium ruizarguesonis]
MTRGPFNTICCDMPKTKTKSKEGDDPELIREWPLPVVATLGSGVRVKGILLEIRSRLPSPVRKSLDMPGRRAHPRHARDCEDSIQGDGIVRFQRTETASQTFRSFLVRSRIF